jgi:hypothetical protein
LYDVIALAIRFSAVTFPAVSYVHAPPNIRLVVGLNEAGSVADSPARLLLPATVRFPNAS